MLGHFCFQYALQFPAKLFLEGSNENIVEIWLKNAGFTYVAEGGNQAVRTAS